MKIFNRKPKKSKKQRIAGTASALVGTEAHKTAWDIILSPADLAKRRRQIGENVSLLKQMSYDELLEHWNIPKEGVPRLKRMLMFEIILLMPVLYVCGWSVWYGIGTGNFYGISGGIMVGIVCMVSMMQRHRWYKIVAGEKYHTFKEYVFGRPDEPEEV